LLRSFYVPVALIIWALCAWFFFRQLTPPLSVGSHSSGGLGGECSIDFFSDACGGRVADTPARPPANGRRRARCTRRSPSCRRTKTYDDSRKAAPRWKVKVPKPGSTPDDLRLSTSLRDSSSAAPAAVRPDRRTRHAVRENTGQRNSSSFREGQFLLSDVGVPPPPPTPRWFASDRTAGVK